MMFFDESSCYLSSICDRCTPNAWGQVPSATTILNGFQCRILEMTGFLIFGESSWSNRSLARGLRWMSLERGETTNLNLSNMYYNTGGAVITPTNNATAAYEKYGDISDDWGVSPLLDNIMYGVFFCQTPSPHLMRILVKMGGMFAECMLYIQYPTFSKLGHVQRARYESNV